VWDRGFTRDPRFVAALRIDPLLVDWPNAAKRLAEWGYRVSEDFSGQTFGEVRRFLADWTRKPSARQYCMVSLPPDFDFPSTRRCEAHRARHHATRTRARAGLRIDDRRAPASEPAASPRRR
jgi:hypothetical protein